MNGATVGITAARRSAEQAALVVAMGGVPRHGPSVDVDRPVGSHALVRVVAEILRTPPDIAVFMTGVGARHLLDAARAAGTLGPLTGVLARARVVARGGKPRRALREFGVRVDDTVVPAEGDVVRDTLLAAGVARLRILIQCADSDPEPMAAPLRAAGASVLAVGTYSVDPAPDACAALALARSAGRGELDAITFTSAHAVHGLVAVAERAGLDLSNATRDGCLVAAVGPVTRRALLAHDLDVHVEPATPRMGAMYRDLARALAASGSARIDRRGLA